MQVKNRLVMPPMSLNFGVDDDGYVTAQHWEYLAARARGGTGMIVLGVVGYAARKRLAFGFASA